MTCPVCSAPLQETSSINKIFSVQNHYCKSCDSYHLLDEQDMSRYYSQEYHADFNFKKYKKTSLLKDYFSKPRNFARYHYLNKYSNEKRFDNILEIGGGNGDFFSLIDAKWHPKQYTIVEPNPSYNLDAENLKYYNTLFEDVADSDLSNVDAIVMFHVLEHIYDVDRFLERVKKISPKYLYFEVPNIASEQVKEDSLSNHPHYHHYSEKSLRKLFDKHGFGKYQLDSVMPVTYHPYNKVSTMSRVINKILGKNEVVDAKGLYLRGLIDLT